MQFSSNLAVSRLTADDYAAWEVLARGYKAFYKTEVSAAEYEATWRRLIQQDGVVGLGAKAEGKLIGIVHYLFHTTVWAPKVCYLQDLFVSPESRGKGVARALIEAVVAHAKREQAMRCYWHTQEHNTTARALYDNVAKFNGFIRYEIAL
jgi:GNAT superfamily N-acetyltransferase